MARIYPSRTQTPKQVTATAAGNTLFLTPKANHKITITYLEYSGVAASGGTVCAIRFGATGDLIHKSRILAGYTVVRNFVETEIETKESVYINLETAVDTSVTIHYYEHSMEATL